MFNSDFFKYNNLNINESGDLNDINCKINLYMTEQLKQENVISMNLDDDNNENSTNYNQNKITTQDSRNSINSIIYIDSIHTTNNNNINNNENGCDNDFDNKSIISQERTSDEKKQDDNLKKIREDNFIQKQEDKVPVANNPNPKNSKPGRKKNTSKENYQEHNKFTPDNCRIKIKSHFHNFIINFFNMLIKKKFRKQIYKFRKLPYSLIKDGSKKFNKSLLIIKIKDLLIEQISNKYKNVNKFQNQNTLNKSKLEEDYNNLLNMKYMDFYKEIYLADNDKDLWEIYKINKLSIKGEFHQIFNKKNKEYEDIIRKVANKEFIEYFLSIKNLKNDY